MRDVVLGRVSSSRGARREGRAWRLIEIDRERRQLRIDEWLLRLSPALLEILYLLASRAGAYVSLGEIQSVALDVQGGHENSIRDRIYQQIRRLRRVLPAGLRIAERRHKGYRLVRSTRRASSRIGVFRS